MGRARRILNIHAGLVSRRGRTTEGDARGTVVDMLNRRIAAIEGRRGGKERGEAGGSCERCALFVGNVDDEAAGVDLGVLGEFSLFQMELLGVVVFVRKREVGRQVRPP